jgi:polar amino acid transport system substrate-binding protein
MSNVLENINSFTEDAMRRNWIAAAVLGLLLNGCAGVQTAPTQEEKQALAPTGKLRVGFISGSPIHATKDAASGEFKGVAVDLGKELARRIGVPFEPVAYTSVPALIAGAKTGQWDVATMGISTERALLVDFTAPYMEVEFSYLVPKGSPISTQSDVDRRGIRIGVVEKASPDVYLTGTIRSATLVRAPTIAGMVESLRAGRADVLFGTKAGMLSQAEKLAGSRVLEGRSGGENTGMAVPKRRDSSAAYVRQFVESAKSEGLVKAAIERAALRGVVVAPLK